MGVYFNILPFILLYMSKPKLIKRGSDDIDFEQLKKEVISEMNFKLANTTLKKEYHQAIKDNVNKILDGLEKGTFTYNDIENLGFRNSERFIDTPGLNETALASGIVGSVIRRSDIYTHPIEEVIVPEQDNNEQDNDPFNVTDKPDKYPIPDEDTSVVYTDFQDYLNKVHPRPTNQLNNVPFKFDLNERTKYKRKYQIILLKALNSISNKDLLQIIHGGLISPMNINSGNKHNLNLASPIVKAFGGVPKFSNQYILWVSLEIARRKNILKQCTSTNPNQYYIPVQIKGRHEKNIGFLYDISNDKIPTISASYYHDIPYFQEQWKKEWKAQLPQQHKEGGTIKKLAIGGSADWKNVAKYDFSDPKRLQRMMWIIKDQNWKERGTLQATNNINPNSPEYDYNWPAADLEASDDYRSWIADLTNENNKDLAEHWSNEYINSLSAENSKNKFYDLWYDSDPNDSAKRIFNFEKFKEYVKDDKQVKTWFDQKGGPGHDRYFKSVWFDPEDNKYHADLVKGYVADGDWIFDNEKKVWIRKMIKDPNAKPEDVVGENELPVNEEEIKDNWWNNFSPDFLDLLRYKINVNGTNKAMEALHYNPMLKDPINIERQVVGNEGTKQAYNRQAANYRFSFERDVDPNRNALQHAMAQSLGNDAMIKGNLADNQKIDETSEAKFNNRKDLLIRNKAITDENINTINEAQQYNNQLEAGRIRGNTASKDQLLRGFTTRWRNKLDLLDKRRTEMQEAISQNVAKRWYDRVMEQAETDKDNWIKSETLKHGTTPDITTWQKYRRYQYMRSLAEDMYKALLYKDMARINNLKYTSPYTEDAYNNFMTWT